MKGKNFEREMVKISDKVKIKVEIETNQAFWWYPIGLQLVKDIYRNSGANSVLEWDLHFNLIIFTFQLCVIEKLFDCEFKFPHLL